MQQGIKGRSDNTWWDKRAFLTCDRYKNWTEISASGSQRDSRYLTEVAFHCEGYYDTTKGRVDPFLIDCGDDGKAAVSPVEGGEEPSEFKVWIHPPSQPLSEDESAWLHPRLEEPAKPLAELKARADEGDAEAMYMYAFRIDDRAESWKFRCLAANKNHPNAQGLIAVHYRQGRDPVERDLLRAYVWYRLAESNGYEGGQGTGQTIKTKTETGWKWSSAKQPYSEVLAANMTPSELADGERLVSKWKPNPAECAVAPKSPGS